MKLLTAVGALLACSGALAQDAPPPPWERLNFASLVSRKIR
jgi:hypothetical protein